MIPVARNVVFTIHYKADFGQSIAIIGSMPSIGSWTEFNNSHLKWTHGDKWQIELKIDRVFQYKYVLLEKN